MRPCTRLDKCGTIVKLKIYTFARLLAPIAATPVVRSDLKYDTRISPTRDKDGPLYGWPPVAPVELVPPEEVSTIAETNVGIGVVVVEHKAQARVREDTPTIVSH